MRFQDKVAVIAGGGGSIGRGIALRLAREGATIAVADLDQDAAQRTIRENEASGGKGVALRLDVTRLASVEEAARAIREAFGKIDVLVNVFGTNHPPTPAVDLAESDWQRVLEINLTGVFRCCRTIGAIMREQRNGKIINIGSINGVTPPLLSVAYNASKAAVLSLTRTLAYELAPFNVQVNAINPGPVDTPLVALTFPKRAALMGMTSQAYYEELRTMTPTRRLSTVEDVAAAVAFLASSDANNIVAVDLDVSGGLLVIPSSIQQGMESPLV